MKLKCKNVVYRLLEEKPELRDNDIKLIQWVWRIESRLYLQLDNCAVYELFLMMQNKKISHASSIKRARAKMQELHIHLRGEVYNKRHKIQKDTLFDLDTMGAENTGTSY